MRKLPFSETITGFPLSYPGFPDFEKNVILGETEGKRIWNCWETICDAVYTKYYILIKEIKSVNKKWGFTF